ncbi:MAG: polysaccharide deacetylase family protein [Desulfobacteraceae bacterium]|nr:polysaccharide deacetylase family protein [Desulfobacteraceae bacterium]
MIILLYHDIDTSDDPSEKTDAATLGTVARLTEFEAQMKFLSDNGYKAISVERYLENMRQNDVSPNQVVLTFDDGHASNFKYAFPILKKYGFSASFFIIADRIDQIHHMTSAQIRTLRENGMEIGSHGLTHTWLPLLDRTNIVHELKQSKLFIEKKVRAPVTTFAYPGGHYTGAMMKEIRNQGYRAALSCILGINTGTTDPYLLRRVEIRRGTGSDDFEKALQPFSIRMYSVIDQAKTALKQFAGLERYEILRHRLYQFYPFKR